MTRYSPLNRYIPKLEDLYENAEMMLKGYGFSEDEIHREYPLGSTQKRIDMAGVKDGFSVGIELGRCSPERMFECVKYFDRVIWLPYWFTEIGKKTITADMWNEIVHENTKLSQRMDIISHRMDNILTKTRALLTDFNAHHVCVTVEGVFVALRNIIDNIQKFYQFLEGEL